MIATQNQDGKDRIVVAVDGSEQSKNALRWARPLAEATSSDIGVVAVWQPYTNFGWAGGGWSAMPIVDWDPERDAEKSVLATIDEVYGHDQPDALTVSVLEGNPAKILIEISQNARMLVVGNRGHGGFAGLLLGSVSAACTEHAVCPVLVVHGATPPPAAIGVPA